MEDKKERLFNAAHNLFLKQGFKTTNIAEIAEQAGVAVGSFYRFYNSKEDIFVQVYNYENETVKQKIMNNLDFNQAPQKLVSTVLEEIFKATVNNTILQEWFNDSKINHIIIANNRDALEDGVVYATLNRLIDQWIVEKRVKSEMNKTRIMSLFSALTVVDIHQKEITTDNYFQTLDDLIHGILTIVLK